MMSRLHNGYKKEVVREIYILDHAECISSFPLAHFTNEVKLCKDVQFGQFSSG